MLQTLGFLANFMPFFGHFLVVGGEQHDFYFLPVFMPKGAVYFYFLCWIFTRMQNDGGGPYADSGWCCFVAYVAFCGQIWAVGK